MILRMLMRRLFFVIKMQIYELCVNVKMKSYDKLERIHKDFFSERENLMEDAVNLVDAGSDALLDRLKDIAEDTTEYKISEGAMCYCPVYESPKYKTIRCNVCNKRIGEEVVFEYETLVICSGKIKKSGIARVKIVCTDCLKRMCMSGNYTYDMADWRINVDSPKNKNQHIETDDWHIVLLIKPADYEKTHLALVGRYDLECLLAFFKDKKKWRSDYGRTILLRDDIKVIERLTGLKL